MDRRNFRIFSWKWMLGAIWDRNSNEFGQDKWHQDSFKIWFILEFRRTDVQRFWTTGKGEIILFRKPFKESRLTQWFLRTKHSISWRSPFAKFTLRLSESPSEENKGGRLGDPTGVNSEMDHRCVTFALQGSPNERLDEFVAKTEKLHLSFFGNMSPKLSSLQ